MFYHLDTAFHILLDKCVTWLTLTAVGQQTMSNIPHLHFCPALQSSFLSNLSSASLFFATSLVLSFQTKQPFVASQAWEGESWSRSLNASVFHWLEHCCREQRQLVFKVWNVTRGHTRTHSVTQAVTPEQRDNLSFLRFNIQNYANIKRLGWPLTRTETVKLPWGFLKTRNSNRDPPKSNNQRPEARLWLFSQFEFEF